MSIYRSNCRSIHRPNYGPFSIVAIAAVLFAWPIGHSAVQIARADEPSVRSQAIVNLTFDEPTGDALDSASVGAAKDNAAFVNGARRVKSPFWGQSGKQAVILDAAAKQFLQIADSPDVDRPDAVSLSMFFVNLHPASDTAARGLLGKRDDGKPMTNYGINFVDKTDVFQVYLNDGTGYKIASFSLNAAIGHRKPVFITAVFQVGDAPAPDADEDKDDVLVRFYSNGHPVKPKGATGGTVVENDVWLIDVKVGNLVNDVPLILCASTPGIEHASCVIDEFSLFSKALSHDEVSKLFVEVAGANVAAQIAEESKPLPAGPEISSLSLSGITRGQTSILTVTGTNLLPEPVLVSAAPIEKQALRPGATAERIEFDVTVPATAPAGHFPIRVQTPRGISGPLTVAVDSLPEIPYAESTPDKPVALPVAVSGSLSGQKVAKIYFVGKAGQRVVVDLECKRLGAAMDPVLELRNPRGAPLSIAWGRPQYGGDTRIEAHLFADGVYSVEIHDLKYQAPGENRFRIKIGDLKLIDTTFPAAVSSGTQRAVSAIGPGIDPAATLTVDMQDQPPGQVRLIALPAETGAVGPAPSVVSSGAVEIMEEPPTDGKLQSIDAQFAERAHIPIVINGRISRHGESDRYVLQVKPGLSISLSAEGYSMHSPLDAQLMVLSHPDGNRLAISEERPALDFGVPAGTSAIEVAISDLNHRGGPEYVYRLRIARQGHPDFSLSVGSERVRLARDGSAVVRLDANRAGYDGPIALALQGAPDISLSPAEIPAGASKSFVVLSAKSAEASPGVLIRHLRISGTSAGLDPPLVRVAHGPPDGRLAFVPGTRSDLTCALTGPTGAALELGALPPVWFRGSDPEIPLTLKVQNAELSHTAVRLSLMTTEAPRTEIDPKDPAKQKRIPVPLLHSLPGETLSAGETAGVLRVAVPLEVVEGQIDCVVRAEFVPHAYSDKVLATVYSTPFRLPVQNAVSVQLAANNLALTGNAQTKFTGTVKRTARFTGAVDVSLVNLRPAIRPPR
ncbi:MAG TPA: hypothetical protein VGH74_22615 [Planctomycetaceae bacterium]